MKHNPEIEKIIEIIENMLGGDLPFSGSMPAECRWDQGTLLELKERILAFKEKRY